MTALSVEEVWWTKPEILSDVGLDHKGFRAMKCSIEERLFEHTLWTRPLQPHGPTCGYRKVLTAGKLGDAPIMLKAVSEMLVMKRRRNEG